MKILRVTLALFLVYHNKSVLVFSMMRANEFYLQHFYDVIISNLALKNFSLLLREILLEWLTNCKQQKDYQLKSGT